MEFMRIYIINCISSESFLNGRESKLWHSADPEDVSRIAYHHYLDTFSKAKSENVLDDASEEPLSFREFTLLMKAGFAGGNDLVLIQCVDHHLQYEASSISYIGSEHMPPIRYDIRDDYSILPTNREFLVRSLVDPNWQDDGGASYDSWLNYNINCPYMSGDKRAHCYGKPDEYICWDNCNICKEEWLEQEVDT